MMNSLVLMLFIIGEATSWTTNYHYWRTTTYPYWWTTTTTATKRAATTPRENYQSFHGRNGLVSEYGYSTPYPEIHYYHIDNPNNEPVVVHFQSFSLRDCYNCSCESLTFYPRDWPYNKQLLRYCGHSLPGSNGYLYIPSLGTIEYKKEAYSYSSFSFNYEIFDGHTTPDYGYGTSAKPFIGKSRLLQIIQNMQHQLESLAEEAKFAHDLLDDSQINNFARRKSNVNAKAEPENGNSNSTISE